MCSSRLQPKPNTGEKGAAGSGLRHGQRRTGVQCRRVVSRGVAWHLIIITIPIIPRRQVAPCSEASRAIDGVVSSLVNELSAQRRRTGLPVNFSIDEEPKLKEGPLPEGTTWRDEHNNETKASALKAHSCALIIGSGPPALPLLDSTSPYPLSLPPSSVVAGERAARCGCTDPSPPATGTWACGRAGEGAGGAEETRL